jgi:hypothetical protein
MTVSVKILKTIRVTKNRRNFMQSMKTALKQLREKRRQGNPDRLGEEELVHVMGKNQAMTEKFFANGGYPWDGSN